jgi:hypothetical protein
MMRQRMVVLREACGKQRFKRLRGAFMQLPPPFQQHRMIGHLMGQRVLEGVGPFGEQVRLIEEFRRLQVRQAAVQHGLRHIRNGLQ